VVVSAVALVAGAGVDLALRLGAAMTALQCSIGALNDIVDAPADAGRVPPKPIPSGAVPPSVARVVTGAAACLGSVLAATVGVGLALLGGLVLVIGYTYDLVAKGTPWSWLPFAVGIPILPVFGWYGAAGSLPPFFAALVPMAVLAGAALAIGNARSDLDTDRAAGTRSVATALGEARAWLVEAMLLAASVGLAVGWLLVEGAGLPAVGAVIAAGAVLGSALLAARATGRDRRWAWEFEAVAAAGALMVWLAVLPRPSV
jgi:4-hydroxybenzoate polyprenyltransferase